MDRIVYAGPDQDSVDFWSICVVRDPGGIYIHLCSACASVPLRVRLPGNQHRLGLQPLQQVAPAML